MTERIKIYKVVPEVYQALQAFGQVAGEGIDEELKQLVQLRASQINRCAFCIDMHSKDARHVGVSEERIQLVAAFEEAPEHFTEKERAALALTESMTVLTDGFVPDAVYDRAAKHFEEKELARLIAVIAGINTWNRMNVAARTAAGHYKPGQLG